MRRKEQLIASKGEQKTMILPLTHTPEIKIKLDKGVERCYNKRKKDKNMEKIVNQIHESMKDNPAYSLLSLDQQGEFCVKLAELVINYLGE